MERFGEKLRTLRKKESITVRQLASILEIKSHSHIVGLEANKHKPSVDLILKMADFFEVTTDQLMRDDLEID
jgi:transcriptional regulator with XRE-family HTH domain